MKFNGYICNGCGIRTSIMLPENWLFLKEVEKLMVGNDTSNPPGVTNHYCPKCAKPFIELRDRQKTEEK